MKILITGANGNISWWLATLALSYDYEVYAIGRSFNKDTRKALPDSVVKLNYDLRNIVDIKKQLKNNYFDVVCDFICYNRDHAVQAIDLYKNITNHYIFISSEAIYKRETKYLPFRETTPRADPKYSGNYIKGKIEAEEVFLKAYEDFDFPVTILRPSFTYDTLMPTSIGLNCYTATKLYIEDRIALIAGDGNNLWTFTHSTDFCKAILQLIETKNSIGQDYHITTDEWLTWNDATGIIIDSLGLENIRILHVPKELIMEQNLLGEKDLLMQRMSHNIFDNSKIKEIIPNWDANINFAEGVKDTIKWLHEDVKRQRINPKLYSLISELYPHGKIYDFEKYFGARFH